VAYVRAEWTLATIRDEREWRVLVDKMQRVFSSPDAPTLGYYSGAWIGLSTPTAVRHPHVAEPPAPQTAARTAAYDVIVHTHAHAQRSAQRPRWQTLLARACVEAAALTPSCVCTQVVESLAVPTQSVGPWLQADGTRLDPTHWYWANGTAQWGDPITGASGGQNMTAKWGVANGTQCRALQAIRVLMRSHCGC
jgi:hypothetical protein